MAREVIVRRLVFIEALDSQQRHPGQIACPARLSLEGLLEGSEKARSLSTWHKLDVVRMPFRGASLDQLALASIVTRWLANLVIFRRWWCAAWSDADYVAPAACSLPTPRSLRRDLTADTPDLWCQSEGPCHCSLNFAATFALNSVMSIKSPQPSIAAEAREE
jgi:hypothetical protein